MKIALVHDFLFKLGGAERVLKVMADIFPNAPLYTLLYDEEKTGSVFPKHRVISSPLQRFPKFLLKRPQMLLGKMPQAIESFDFSSFDLVISSSGAFSHGVITGPQTKHLCYCHSPMRYSWDYTHEYLEEKKLSFPVEWMVRNMLHRLRQWDRASADRPDTYLANSQHVQKRIQKYFGQDSSVLYPPVNTERFYPLKPSKGYFLIISALSSFKKIELAIGACNKIGKELMIIGEGQHRKNLEALAGPTIRFLGRRSDEEVKEILEEAEALLFPGEEDFGITPVEAMAAGRPVIAYAKGGILETVIDSKTGVFFQDPTLSSLEEALEKYYSLKNKNAFDRYFLHEHAGKFHPQFFQKGLKEAVEELMGSGIK